MAITTAANSGALILKKILYCVVSVTRCSGVVGGVAGAALSFGAGLAKGQGMYGALGDLAVAGATAAMRGACPACVAAYGVANASDPAIGQNAHSLATGAAKDVCLHGSWGPVGRCNSGSSDGG